MNQTRVSLIFTITAETNPYMLWNTGSVRIPLFKTSIQHWGRDYLPSHVDSRRQARLTNVCISMNLHAQTCTQITTFLSFLVTNGYDFKHLCAAITLISSKGADIPARSIPGKIAGCYQPKTLEINHKRFHLVDLPGYSTLSLCLFSLISFLSCLAILWRAPLCVAAKPEEEKKIKGTFSQVDPTQNTQRVENSSCHMIPSLQPKVVLSHFARWFPVCLDMGQKRFVQEKFLKECKHGI